MFVKNVEVLPEVFSDNFSCSICDSITDLGEAIKLKRRGVRRHCSETEGWGERRIGYWGVRVREKMALWEHCSAINNQKSISKSNSLNLFKNNTCFHGSRHPSHTQTLRIKRGFFNLAVHSKSKRCRFLR